MQVNQTQNETENMSASTRSHEEYQLLFFQLYFSKETKLLYPPFTLCLLFSLQDLYVPSSSLVSSAQTVSSAPQGHCLLCWDSAQDSGLLVHSRSSAVAEILVS